MLSYLNEPKERLRVLAGGMEKNSAKWTSDSVLITDAQKMILDIENKDKEIEGIKQLQTQKLNEARTLSYDAGALADKIENLANGFNSGDEVKLLEYGIKPRKAIASKGLPDAALHPILEDDADGEGFVVSTNADAKADYYEWMKGTGANVADINVIPELKMFKTTKKTYFHDDEVPKGVRVFYKVRACNANGAGPWSEAVSRVQ